MTMTFLVYCYGRRYFHFAVHSSGWQNSISGGCKPELPVFLLAVIKGDSQLLGAASTPWLMPPPTFSIFKTVLPDVRISEHEERRLPRQCNSQKGKFITDSSQGFLPQPTQWCRVRNSLKQSLLAKFIRYAEAVSSWLKLIGYMFTKQFYWYKLSRAFQLSLCFLLGAY